MSEASAFERTFPPPAADEATMLRSYLDYFRATILRQTEGLDAVQLATPLPPTTMTLGGILKHLTWVENWWWVRVLEDGPELSWVPDGVFEADRDWEWNSAKDDSWALPRLPLPGVRREGRRGARPRPGVVQGPGPAGQGARAHGKHATVRWILVHMVEEYARHAGHADLIREAIDGRTDL